MKMLATLIQSKMNRLSLGVLLGTAVLLPLIVLPLSDNFLLWSKFFALFLATFLIFLLWTLSAVAKKSVQITLSPFVTPLVLLAVVAFISNVANSTYIVNSLLNYGGLYIALTVLFIAGSSLIEQKDSKLFVNALVLPGLLLSLFTGAELLGFGPSKILNSVLSTQFPNSPVFSLSGSPLAASEFLVLALVGVVITTFTQKKKKATPFYIVCGAAFLLAIIVNVYTLVKAQASTQIFLPYAASWSIMIDGLKSLKSSIIGFGPDNYGIIYLHLKPTWINTTPYWTLQFVQANNLFLELISTVGILGLGSWVLLLVKAVRRIKHQTAATLPAAGIFFAALIMEFIVPPNPVLLGTQILALIFWVASERHAFQDLQIHSFTIKMVKSDERTQRVPEHNNGMVYGIAAANTVILLAVLYLLGRATLGSFFIFLGEIAAIKSNVLGVYNDQQTAIQMNPYIDSYRRKFSNTNMTIAFALSNMKDQNNPDKDKIPTLVQQAIQQARVAAVLNPYDGNNWVNLARIYANLIGSSDQAAQFAADSYSQAISDAPNDPILRLELGGVLYRTKNYDQAIQEFTQLIALKPNWPNAYYNLAVSYRQKQQYTQAFDAYQQTLSLLDSSSDDYKRIKSEIADMQKEADAAAKNTKQSNAAPATTQEQTVNLASPTAASGSAQFPPKKVQNVIQTTQQASPTP